MRRLWALPGQCSQVDSVRRRGLTTGAHQLFTGAHQLIGRSNITAPAGGSPLRPKASDLEKRCSLIVSPWLLVRRGRLPPRRQRPPSLRSPATTGAGAGPAGGPRPVWETRGGTQLLISLLRRPERRRAARLLVLVPAARREMARRAG